MLTNATGVPKFKQDQGHVVFQIVTRAHGREIKHVRKPGRPAGTGAMPTLQIPQAGLRSTFGWGDRAALQK